MSPRAYIPKQAAAQNIYVSWFKQVLEEQSGQVLTVLEYFACILQNI